jgi:hypothetical protein
MSLTGRSVHLDQNGPGIDDSGLVTAVRIAHRNKSTNKPAARFHAVFTADAGGTSKLAIAVTKMNSSQIKSS